jgi:hypothetical protein
MSILGGLMGSEEKTVGKTAPTSQTTNSSSSHGSSTQHKIDPRMEQAIYGAGGIMPNASAWYAQNQSGLNDKMVTGMNNQWNQLGASKQGFDQMQNLGMGLMGGGTAGNPFTGGGGIAPQNLTYKPAEMSNSASPNSPFTMPVAAPAPSMSAGAPSGGGGGGGMGYDSDNNNADKFSGAAPSVDSKGTWIEDTEGGGYWSGANNSPNGAFYGGYRPISSNYQSIVPTASTAGYGGYGGYSTLPAYSYPNGGGNGGE